MVKNILAVVLLTLFSVSSAWSEEIKAFNGLVEDVHGDRLTVQLMDDLSTSQSVNGRRESFRINEKTKCIFRRDNYNCSKIKNMFVITAVTRDTIAIKIVIREVNK